MNRALADVLRHLASLEEIACDGDLRLSFMDTVIAEMEEAGESLLMDVRCHPLDAPAMVEEYECCRPANRVEEGWIRIVLLTSAGRDEISAVMEAFRSAMDRVAPDGEWGLSGKGGV
ncbi:hypothetical protein GX411_00635 [Candidatus Fermentibacteria bacterium]|nr:hypothetical protein [Candidatus Fermentibacteria bacterium]